MDVRVFLALSIGALILVLAVFRWQRQFRQLRRARLRAQPLAQQYIRILEKNVPLYARLPDTLKADLHSNMQVFLDEKEFFGRAGLKITDEMRLTIAGNACLLLLNRPNNCFPGFKTILVYPQTYQAMHEHREGHLVTEQMTHLAGESWHRGPVILAWDDVLYGSRTGDDGFNVVLHEFAHKLDEENQDVDGAPLLNSSADYQDWARVFSKGYQAFVRQVRNAPDDAIDDYAATSPEEFFAVCTETFFEKPQSMQQQWPELYQQLARFYAVDPASWPPSSNIVA